MEITVRLFGGLTEYAGRSRIEVDLAPDATVALLRTAIAEQYPSLGPLLGGVKVAVDLEVARDDDPVAPDAEVALLPPVAGGAGDADVSGPASGRDPSGGDAPSGGGDDAGPAGTAAARALPSPGRHGGVTTLTGLVTPPIDVTAALAAVAGPDVGGTAIFLGTVRDHAPDLDGVVGLDYSTYPEMAEKVLADLAVEVADDHPEVRGIALVHAVGELAVGDHTILIVCAAAHRAPAFAACRDALERVKDRTPIWKRERTADGGHRWVGLPDAGPTPPDAEPTPPAT